MNKNQLSATYSDGAIKMELSISIFSWEEDTIFYVYCPALDLTGYGKTPKEAKLNFENILEEFIIYTHNKKTIFKELERLGWAINKRKKKLVSPDLEEMLTDNEHFSDLYRTKTLKEETSSVNFDLV